ncbi:AzlD domain-containing protein [Weissella confusa]|uniref:Branched-chain amino acid ABC transporter n=1 Tax=Weissella confusa TaxID=1583 RepID=A0A4Z0S6B1_WEICO|nr:AzlD domain-containing protein [Weissella confusa]TGE76128.1 branched-chain amino acid ABC transporter [Weissella confusa]
MTSYYVIVLITAGLVTWLPRISPFVLVRFGKLPNWLQSFLAFIPLSLMTALFFENLVVIKTGQLPGINWLAVFAMIPTLLTIWRTKSIMWTVLVGIISMAILRAI